MSKIRCHKCTPELEAGILECVEAGMALARACELLGISEDGLRKHRKANPEFSTLVEAALVEREKLFLKNIGSGMKGWQGPAWILSKTRPERYGKKVDEASPVVAPVVIQISEEPAKRLNTNQQIEECPPSS